MLEENAYLKPEEGQSNLICCLNFLTCSEHNRDSEFIQIIHYHSGYFAN